MGHAGLKSRTAAVVFARGAGDAVPFLSVRLLAGRPVLHYALEACRSARGVGSVWVSTEDERIAETAREAGAGVILRPEGLSRHETPMLAAVEHASLCLREGACPGLEALACVQADAVFCSCGSIERALEAQRKGGFDRVVGVVPEFKKLVVWREDGSGGFSLVVPPPHLRRGNERHFSEPGVVTVWKAGPRGVRIKGGSTGHILIDEREAFRVDTERDLRAAERIIGPRRLALRCDGSPRMGMGHVVRLLNLAEHLGPGWLTRFFVGSEHLEGARMLAERGRDVDVVLSGDPGHWARRIREFDPEVVINDLPFVPAGYSESLCDLPAKSITLVDSVADIDPRTERLDTVISLIDEKLSLPCERFYSGPSFAALHPSIRRCLARPRKRRFRPGPVSALVALGTGDPLRLTPGTLEALAGAREQLRSLAVVVRREHQDDAFRAAAGPLGRKVRVVTSPSERLGDLLERADVAIVSGGITAYEAGAMGVPAIVLCQNERELSRMRQFERNGSIVLLGMGSEATPGQIRRAFLRLCDDPALRLRLSEAGLKTSDGKGIERISSVIGELLAAR
jgi:spore coat polysaccharide biosynthesis predicted glycosyltransferase SpsG/CMP-N-acetylneuraminic acid synthetase